MERFHRLAHSIWDCKYHVVWIPKCRRKELYGSERDIVVMTIKQWARLRGIEIIEGHASKDHIHLCLAIPPNLKSMLALCKEYQATMVVDVAHDFGSLGPQGTGRIGEENLLGQVDIVMGSFSKSFASNGGLAA